MGIYFDISPFYILRKVMYLLFINKIGADHLLQGLNCQDYGFIKDNMKLVCDGCSEGRNSEVGVKIFCQFMSEGETIETCILTS